MLLKYRVPATKAIPNGAGSLGHPESPMLGWRAKDGRSFTSTVQWHIVRTKLGRSQQVGFGAPQHAFEKRLYPPVDAELECRPILRPTRPDIAVYPRTFMPPGIRKVSGPHQADAEENSVNPEVPAP